MKPIYKPKARAKEYGDLAINIYTGCNHGCTYCYAAKMAKRFGKDFTNVEPRKDIVSEVAKQLERENITGKLIHLCFMCDPYPAEIDTTPTREIIKLIKNSGNHVQILTKGGNRALRDFDLLDSGDWFGVTYTGYESGKLFKKCEQEPNAAPPYQRLYSLKTARNSRINTWMSCEPVLNEADIFTIIECAVYIDKFKIGKLNYYQSNINWGEFGRKCERICKAFDRDYYIKDDLQKEMKRK